MPNQTSDRLKNHIPQIMNLWENRVLDEVKAAHFQKKMVLRNSIPDYLDHLVDALSTTIDRSEARKSWDKKVSNITGKEHGKERAENLDYTIDQLISEYHILRQVICDVMEVEAVLTPVEREVIVCSLEQAVSDAATEFSGYRKQVQELIETVKTRDEFLSIASHELKTPLTSLKLQLELVLRQISQGKTSVLDPESLKRVFTLSVLQLNKLNKMVTDLLSVSMIHLGRMEIHLVAGVNLSTLMKEVIDRTKMSVISPSLIDINLKLPDSPLLANVDPSRLEQVVTNLLSNAIKYGEDKPILVVLRQSEDDWGEISVQDSGPGISLEDQGKIFALFERVGVDPSISGLGLGLYISQQILKAHGGSIKIESTPGQGSTFIARFPLHRK